MTTIDTDQGRRAHHRHTLTTMPTADREPQQERFHLELSPDDEQLARSAAHAANVPLDEFVREAIRAAANAALVADEWEAFFVRLLQPGRRNEKLAKLLASPSPFDG